MKSNTKSIMSSPIGSDMDEYDSVASHKAVLTEMLIKHGFEWASYEDIANYVLIEHNENLGYIERKKDHHEFEYAHFRITDKGMEFINDQRTDT